MIVKSIPFLVNNDDVKVEENGTNGIGWFDFSYRVQNSDSKNSYGCSIHSVTTTVTSPLITSSTCSLVDNSTGQPLTTSSSLWALIAVAIMLLLTLFVTIIIAICIVRSVSTKKKETKERSSRNCDGEHTLIHLFVVNSNSLAYKRFEPSYSTKYCNLFYFLSR